MPLSKKKREKAISNHVASIILAGGQGSRLFPLTQTRCKPSVSFGGRYRLIDIPLSNSLNSHIDNIYVISQYFTAFLHQHIIETYPVDHTRSAKIHLISPEEKLEHKTWYQGTADAIRQNIEYLRQIPADYFLILSGDQLYNMNYSDIVQFAKDTHADLVIAALPVEEKEAKRMGLLKIDSSSRIMEFIEKPSDPAIIKRFAVPQKTLKGHFIRNENAPHYLASMGIYIFKREALFSLLQESGDDFGKHLIPLFIERGQSCAYIFKGYWEDIGTVASFYEANIALTRKDHCINMYDEENPIFTHPYNLPSPYIKDTLVRNAHISQGSVIEAQEISDSVLGLRCGIKKGTVIRNSVILGNAFYHPPRHQSPPLPKHFVIGENCLLDKVIVDEHTQIGNHVQLINKKQLQQYDGDGIYIRDGIIVVTTGTTLPDHFVL